MAVPFALPDDEINDLLITVIFILSQARLRGTEENSDLQECMERLVGLLVEELDRRSRSSEYDNHLSQTLMLLRQSLNQFTPTLPRIRRRSNFESCCDDCKSFLHEDCAEDCSQVGLILRKIADYETSAICKEGLQEKEDCVRETLFSWLVPLVKRTFWTAVPLIICLVGLHLFQISYSM